MTQENYTVLATKYRPKDFDDLIGQDVLVRTVTNSIENNRIANAFLLTGIRGVGKTTTARIVARALNCIGADGTGGATPKPCGVCVNCKSIAEDRHPDVIEMDAASRTGVDDVRSIIDNANYLPTSARYKIYIIDEVHMLSKNAFNALLKTLEEPPSHVKFIFATTEIRKIPITILSRCQRFDLRRVANDVLMAHLARIAAKEEAEVETEALAVIADASEGSVRDALSLLDQAIAHSDKKVTEQMVRNMMGLADNSKLVALFEQVVGGKIAEGLGTFRALYDEGADPFLVMQELLEFTYLVTKTRLVPESETRKLVPEAQYKKAKELSEKLGIAYLSRCWQMLLKGLSEVKAAPNGYFAAEMVLVRLAHMADLPSPAALIRDAQKESPAAGVDAALAGIQASVAQTTSASRPVTSGSLAHAAAESVAQGEAAIVNDFSALTLLFKQKGEILLYSWLVSDVKLVKFEVGRIEFSVSSSVPSDFAGRVSKNLTDWTGQHWVAVISQESGQPTLKEKMDQEKLKMEEAIAKDPSVEKVLQTFPGASIVEITDK